MPHDSPLYLLTGSTGALGAAFCVELRRRGHRVLTVSTSRLAHSEPDHIVCDLAEPQSSHELRAAIAAVDSTRLHAINCVGMFPGHMTIDEADGTLFASSIRSNLLSVYNVAHALLPLMRKRGGGHFVAFSPHTLYQAYPLMAVFDVAKAGMEQLIRHIANEHVEHGVVANTIAIATLNTEEERRLKPYGDHQQWLPPEEVARSVCDFIAGSSSPAIANGNVLHMFAYSKSYFHQAYYDRIRGGQSLTPDQAGSR